jgi:hypothetical protein
MFKSPLKRGLKYSLAERIASQIGWIEIVMRAAFGLKGGIAFEGIVIEGDYEIGANIFSI